MSETATKQQIEHTPTPWRVGEHPRDNSGSQWREILTDATEYAPSYVGQALGVDAAFIVRAVNAHEALVEALELFVRIYPPNARKHPDVAIAIGKAEAALDLARKH